MMQMNPSQKLARRQYREAVHRLQKYRGRLTKKLEGQNAPKRAIAQLAHRIERLRQRLLRWEQRMKWAGAGVAFGLAGLGISPQAQAQTPVFEHKFGLTGVSSYSAPSFADLDGDGDLDAFVGEFNGNIKYFENTGTSNAPAFSLSISASPFGLTDIGFYSKPTFADLDEDGDLDAFVGATGGNIEYFENTGNSTNPAFAAVSNNPFGLADTGNAASPSFADLDGDGDLDAFVGEKMATSNTLRIRVRAMRQPLRAYPTTLSAWRM